MSPPAGQIARGKPVIGAIDDRHDEAADHPQRNFAGKSAARDDKHRARHEADADREEAPAGGALPPRRERHEIIPERRRRGDERIFGRRHMPREQQAQCEGNVHQDGAAESEDRHLLRHNEAAGAHQRNDAHAQSHAEAGEGDDLRNRQARLAHQFVERRRQAPETAERDEPDEMGGRHVEATDSRLGSPLKSGSPCRHCISRVLLHRRKGACRSLAQRLQATADDM